MSTSVMAEEVSGEDQQVLRMNENLSSPIKTEAQALHETPPEDDSSPIYAAIGRPGKPRAIEEIERERIEGTSSRE